MERLLPQLLPKLRLLQNPIAAGGIPGLDYGSVQKFTMQQLIDAGPVAFNMIVQRYEEIDNENQTLRTELEIEKRKSSDRLVSTLLLLVSQVLLAVGTNLLTSAQVSTGATVMFAGILPAVLAIYLTFRTPRRIHRSKDDLH